MQVSPALKALPRCVEKMELRLLQLGDASRILDIVRARLICKSLLEVKIALNALVKLKKTNKIVLVRMKNRFRWPRCSGWRDIIVNLYLAEDVNRHICELQIVHVQMWNARTFLPGRLVYSRVRNVMELVHMTRGSQDMGLLTTFIKDLDLMPKWFSHWFSDTVLMRKWGKVSTDKRHRVVALDLRPSTWP